MDIDKVKKDADQQSLRNQMQNQRVVKVIIEEPGKEPEVVWYNAIGSIRCTEGTIVKIICPGYHYHV
jgi:hypothetical protein